MSKIFNRGLLTALLVSAAFAAFPAISSATHSWGGYHWARTGNPFTLKLGKNVSISTWEALSCVSPSTSTQPCYLTEATNGGYDSRSVLRVGWNSSIVLDTEIVTGNAKSNLRKCPPTNGRVEICSYTYGTNGWLGVAQIWITGGHIYQGTVKLNDSYFNSTRYNYNQPKWRRLVMCQEIAHTFGLDHQDETFGNTNLKTCMDYTSVPEGTGESTDNEYPGAAGNFWGTEDYHDFAELVAIYNSHNDSTTTVSQTVQSAPGKGDIPPVANDEPELLGTAQWGKLVRSTNHGRTEAYELDLGGGHKVLTHVIWADPEDQPAPVRGRQ